MKFPIFDVLTYKTAIPYGSTQHRFVTSLTKQLDAEHHTDLEEGAWEKSGPAREEGPLGSSRPGQARPGVVEQTAQQEQRPEPSRPGSGSYLRKCWTQGGAQLSLRFWPSWNGEVCSKSQRNMMRNDTQKDVKRVQIWDAQKIAFVKEAFFSTINAPIPPHLQRFLFLCWFTASRSSGAARALSLCGPFPLTTISLAKGHREREQSQPPLDRKGCHHIWGLVPINSLLAIILHHPPPPLLKCKIPTPGPCLGGVTELNQKHLVLQQPLTVTRRA